MRNRTAPLPSSFVFLAAFPFRKHKKGGGDDISTKLDVEGLNLDGDDDALSLGDLGGSLGGSLGSKMGGGDDILSGLTTKSEKVDQLEGTVNELKNQVETIGSTSTSIKGQVESIRKDIEGINDSIKNLLCVYEAVSRQYNPFVDQAVPKAPFDGDVALRADGSKSCKDKPIDEVLENPFGPASGMPRVDEEGEMKMAVDLNAPLDKVLMFDDNSATAKGLQLEGMELETDVDGGEVLAKAPVLEMAEVEPEPAPRIELKMTDGPKAPSREAKVDTYALRQIYKLVDYQLEKVYEAKSHGESVPAEEMEMLERWIHELKLVGVK